MAREWCKGGVKSFINVLVSDTLNTWRTFPEAVFELTCLDYQAILA
jgi:hypothetical protein